MSTYSSVMATNARINEMNKNMVSLKLRYNDMQDVLRSASLDEPTDLEQDIYHLLPVLLPYADRVQADLTDGKLTLRGRYEVSLAAGRRTMKLTTGSVQLRDLKLVERISQAEAFALPTLDITGGAPELNEHFRFLVTGARALGRRVIDRCNLTILLAAGFEDLPEFLASREVEIVASLPCYLEDNVDRQRGSGCSRSRLQRCGG